MTNLDSILKSRDVVALLTKVYLVKAMVFPVFMYDLNQIPNDYTVKVRNRFKGLDLIDRVPNEQRFLTLYRRQGSRLSPRKRNANKQNGYLRRP